MKKSPIILFVVFLFVFIAFQQSEAAIKDYYKTFEIIGMTEQNLTLQDSDGNVIEAEKDSQDYKVGYKVIYDIKRQRLHFYRWQDYEIIAISNDSMILQHKTGDTLSVPGNYTGKYGIGDQVRYDSVGNKIQLDENSSQ